MAEVPELNAVSMDSYSENEEEFYADPPCEMKSSMKHLEWTSCHTSWSPCRSGIQSDIKKHRKPVHSFKKAIMLVVVVEKLKGRKCCDKQTFFDDNDLLNHILVEEEISFNTIDDTCAPPSKFRYSKTTVHIIRDSRQKCLTLQEYEGNAHLVALFLQGKNLEQEAKINMGSYISAPVVADKRPVTLGLAGRNLFLSCTPEEDKADTPVLSLTEVTNIQGKRNNDLLPYLFYKTQNTSNSTTFESVAFPGWYISTSQDEHKFVQMKPQDDQEFLRDFVTYPGVI
ncbi:interleukin-1 beta-like [Mixophyes fleayi]|uniref:interleukin-1 beta-like n=1 Tax=Mixophyes fleayi TaxID=3061075 RepID=UPI003F4DADC1